MDKPRLLWSDDPNDQDRVEGKSAGKTSRSPVSVSKSKSGSESVQVALNFTAVFRLEKNGRGGKTVTVIDRLPKHETFIKELCKELKNKCGSGGTFALEGDAGQIEIQGDKRDMIKAIFTAKGIRFKGM